MNKHYFELLNYLNLLTEDPGVILDSTKKVFISEPKSYNNKTSTNHRLHKNYIPVRKQLYQTQDFDETYVITTVQVAAEAMAIKLSQYKADQLPRGRYWTPSDSTKTLLEKIEPTNDICESILGLNDWLQKKTPNMTQRTVTTMVEVMKNATMPWFSKQEKTTKDKIIDMARKKTTKKIQRTGRSTKGRQEAKEKGRRRERHAENT